jgi:hypothetical protein
VQIVKKGSDSQVALQFKLHTTAYAKVDVYFGVLVVVGNKLLSKFDKASLAALLLLYCCIGT